MLYHCLLHITRVAQNLGVPWLGRKLRFFYGMQRLPDPRAESKWGDAGHCWHLGSAGKQSACSAGDLSLIPGLGRSSWEGNSYPLQYSGMENVMDCIVHGATESHMTEHLSPKQCIRICLDLWRWLLHHIIQIHAMSPLGPHLPCSAAPEQGKGCRGCGKWSAVRQKGGLDFRLHLSRAKKIPAACTDCSLETV